MIKNKGQFEKLDFVPFFNNKGFESLSFFKKKNSKLKTPRWLNENEIKIFSKFLLILRFQVKIFCHLKSCFEDLVCPENINIKRKKFQSNL